MSIQDRRAPLGRCLRYRIRPSIEVYRGRLRRCLDHCGAPWFVAKDVCAALEIENSRNATARLDADEKGVRQMDTLKGKQKLTIVSESGLYALILRSDKPAAKKFRKWVTSEVLPARSSSTSTSP